jgi:hypothetical protein
MTLKLGSGFRLNYDNIDANKISTFVLELILCYFNTTKKEEQKLLLKISFIAGFSTFLKSQHVCPSFFRGSISSSTIPLHIYLLD